MTMKARTNEPIFWSLFGAGGVVVAFVLPMLILLTGIAYPLGWLPE
jgi:fumarate reductase subunit D